MISVLAFVCKSSSNRRKLKLFLSSFIALKFVVVRDIDRLSSFEYLLDLTLFGLSIVELVKSLDL